MLPLGFILSCCIGFVFCGFELFLKIQILAASDRVIPLGLCLPQLVRQLADLFGQPDPASLVLGAFRLEPIQSLRFY